jgi:hypothetical protein
MPRKLIIGLLALGAIGGFASGFCSLRCNYRQHRAEMDEHVTHVCADAIRQAQTK